MQFNGNNDVVVPWHSAASIALEQSIVVIRLAVDNGGIAMLLVREKQGAVAMDPVAVGHGIWQKLRQTAQRSLTAANGSISVNWENTMRNDLPVCCKKDTVVEWLCWCQECECALWSEWLCWIVWFD